MCYTLADRKRAETGIVLSYAQSAIASDEKLQPGDRLDDVVNFGHLTIMWSTPAKDLTLENKEVHVWRAELDLPAEQVQELAKTLSEDEQLRAQRFHFQKHRQRFIVGRGLLRTILGRYLGIKPEQIQFEYSPRGKPRLGESCCRERLQFNLSHSQGLALYGFTRDRRIGIDLEYLRSMPDAGQIAKRFFSPREYAAISALPPDEKQKAFFRCWTGKEAYLKATGDGLAGSLDQIEVSLTPDEPARLLSIQGNSRAASSWSLYNLTPASDYIGTIVVEGRDWHLSCWQCH